LKKEFSFKRKAEYIAGRYCALKILNSLGITAYNIFSNEDRSPIWPRNVLGSITHANNYVSVSISNDSNLFGLGRDSEYIFSKVHTKEVGLSIAQNKELNYFKGFSEEEFFTLVYSAKESLFKAIYPATKCFFNFDDMEMTYLDHKTFKIKPKKLLNKFFKPGQIFIGSYLFAEGLVHTGIDIKKDNLFLKI
jgi:enterobactin synthetase component D